jgi:hypothetical protein
MNRTEQDQLAAEKGMTLPDNLARDEAMQRHGYDPMPEFQRQAMLAYPTVHPIFAPILGVVGGVQNANA